MSGWFMLAVIVIAAFCGAVIEHVRTSDRYEFQVRHLHNCYVAEINRNKKLTETLAVERQEPVDVILDRLLQDCPDESEVKTFVAGQDPRD